MLHEGVLFLFIYYFRFLESVIILCTNVYTCYVNIFDLNEIKCILNDKPCCIFKKFGTDLIEFV